jgi:hypothetical protein
MTGKSLQYYIEGKDNRGSVVKSFGTPSSPNVVMIDANAQPQMAGDDPLAPSGGSDDEARRDLDDEAAPITGTVAEKPGARHHEGTSATSGRARRLGAVFWTGLAASIVGAGAFAVGMYSLYQAKTYADIVSRDSQGGDSGPFLFNDPNATPYDDRTAEARGNTWNKAGIGLAAGGGVLLAAGVALITVDRVVLAKRSAGERRARGGWYVAPGVAASSAGVAAGGRFW